jgi:hypothetical protein
MLTENRPVRVIATLPDNSQGYRKRTLLRGLLGVGTEEEEK